VSQYLLASLEATAALGASNETAVVRFHTDSWVARLSADGILTEQVAWSWAYLDAWTQMLSMSSGLRDPKRQVELWGVLLSILVGACVSALFVASLTTAISEAEASAKDYRTKLDMVHQYMRHSQLPRPLRAKLMDYFELRYPSKRSFDEVGILQSISHPLREEIALHMCQVVLSALQVVDSAASPGLEGAISTNLERVVYVANDYIIRLGEETEGMYFIERGLVEVIGESGTLIKTLTSNGFFGEMALLDPTGRAVASVRVATYCEGYRLSIAAYERLVHSHPAFKEYLESARKLRLKAEALKKNPRGAAAGGHGSPQHSFMKAVMEAKAIHNRLSKGS